MSVNFKAPLEKYFNIFFITLKMKSYVYIMTLFEHMLGTIFVKL